MEDGYVKICIYDFIDLILKEERSKVREFYMGTLGKATADVMDSYTPVESSMMKLIKK